MKRCPRYEETVRLIVASRIAIQIPVSTLCIMAGNYNVLMAGDAGNLGHSSPSPSMYRYRFVWIPVHGYARIPDRNQRSRSIHVPNTPLCITGGLLAPGGSSPWTNRHANANVTHDASALYDDRALRLQYAKPTYLVRSILQGPNLRDFRTAPHHISSDTVPVPVTTAHLRPGNLERRCVSVCVCNTEVACTAPAYTYGCNAHTCE